MQESDSNVNDQIDTLRSVFRTTGVLHEVHILNLKVWPVLMFPGAKLLTLKVDVEKSLIIFEMQYKNWWGKKTSPKDAIAKCSGLHLSVQDLLGPEMKTEFVFNGVTIFRGPPLLSPKKGRFEGTDYEAGRIVPETPWKFPKKG